MTQTNLFDPLPDTTISLAPTSSLALRRAIEAMKADDSIYTSCPEIVRTAIAEIMLPSYTSAEDQIRALIEANASGLKLIEKFGAKIRDLEQRLSRKTGTT